VAAPAPHQMNSSDAIIWNIERDPALRSTVAAVWFLESAPDRDRMRAAIENMVHELPRFRQRVVEDGPRPSWVAVDRVDIDAHFEYRTMRSGSRNDVLAVARQRVMTPFDHNRPLWQVVVFDGLDDGGAALVFKVHHCIADGIGLVLMLSALVDVEPNPTTRLPTQLRDAPLPRPKISQTARRLRRTLRHPLTEARAALRMVSSAAKLVLPTRRPLSATMRGRSGHFTLDIRSVPLPALRNAAKQSDATLNAAFMALVLDAVDRYHVAEGARADRLRVHMPINIRNDFTANVSGNQWVPARVKMELGRLEVADRIRQVHERLLEVRAEPALPHINTVSAMVQKLGLRASRWIIGGMMKGVDVLASNVPGPQCPIYVAGVKIDEFYAFGPPAGAALNVTLFSYDGVASFGVTIDTAAIPSPERLMASVDAAIAAMVDASSAPSTIEQVVGERS
jgi:diacylglycerol O-acyltransferase / wax synthase